MPGPPVPEPARRAPSALDRPTILAIGRGEPMLDAIGLALDRHDVALEIGEPDNAVQSVFVHAPDLVLLVGDATADEGRVVLEKLAATVATAVVPVALLSDEAGLEERMHAARLGAVAVVPRSASADAMATRIAELARELPERKTEGAIDLGEATLDEVVDLFARRLRSGILSVSGGEGSERVVLRGDRPVTQAIEELVDRLRPLVSQSDKVRWEFREAQTGKLAELTLDDELSSEVDLAALFRDRRLVIVERSPARADDLVVALRQRGAHVVVIDGEGTGLAKARAIDPDVILVDVSGIGGWASQAMQLIRGDNRLRWAALLVTRGEELWKGGAPEPDVLRLAAGLAPLVEPDETLVRRVKESAQPIDVRLETTGPTRLLRAIARAGATVHATVRHRRATVEVDLAQGLVVGARADLGEGAAERNLEGAAALAALFALGSARVRIERREAPTVANMMSPVDDAIAAADRESVPITPSVPPPAGPPSLRPSVPTPAGGSMRPSAGGETDSRSLVMQLESLLDRLRHTLPPEGLHETKQAIEKITGAVKPANAASPAAAAAAPATAPEPPKRAPAGPRPPGAPIPPPAKPAAPVPPAKIPKKTMMGIPAPAAVPHTGPVKAKAPSEHEQEPHDEPSTTKHAKTTSSYESHATSSARTEHHTEPAPAPGAVGAYAVSAPVTAPVAVVAMRSSVVVTGAASSPTPAAAPAPLPPAPPPGALESDLGALLDEELASVSAPPPSAPLASVPSPAPFSPGFDGGFAAPVQAVPEPSTAPSVQAPRSEVLEPTDQIRLPDARTNDPDTGETVLPQRRGGGLVMAAIALVLLALVGGGGVFAWQRGLLGGGVAPPTSVASTLPTSVPTVVVSAAPSVATVIVPSSVATMVPPSTTVAATDVAVAPPTDVPPTTTPPTEVPVTEAPPTSVVPASAVPPVSDVTPPPSEATPPDSQEPDVGDPGETGSTGSRHETEVEYLIDRANYRRTHGELPAAEADYLRVLRLSPTNARAMAGLARVHLARHDARSAATWARRLADGHSPNAGNYVLLGDALAASGDRAGARQAWERALAISPSSHDARQRLGR